MVAATPFASGIVGVFDSPSASAVATPSGSLMMRPAVSVRIARLLVPSIPEMYTGGSVGGVPTPDTPSTGQGASAVQLEPPPPPEPTPPPAQPGCRHPYRIPTIVPDPVADASVTLFHAKYP